MEQDKSKFQTGKNNLEKEVGDMTQERNDLKDQLHQKIKAYDTLNTAMDQLKADHDRDIEDAKAAARVDLLKDY